MIMISFNFNNINVNKLLIEKNNNLCSEQNNCLDKLLYYFFDLNFRSLLFFPTKRYRSRNRLKKPNCFPAVKSLQERWPRTKSVPFAFRLSPRVYLRVGSLAVKETPRLKTREEKRRRKSTSARLS